MATLALRCSRPPRPARSSSGAVSAHSTSRNGPVEPAITGGAPLIRCNPSPRPRRGPDHGSPHPRSRPPGADLRDSPRQHRQTTDPAELAHEGGRTVRFKGLDLPLGHQEAIQAPGRWDFRQPTPSRPIPTLRRVLGARLSGALPTSGRRPGVCERRG